MSDSAIISDFQQEFNIAESFLDDMLKAEQNRDFKAWSQHWHPEDLASFNESSFLGDLDEMQEELGAFKEKVFFGVLRGKTDETDTSLGKLRLRFVWRVIYEREEALIVVGIHQRDGQWSVFENMCHV